jgi:hypothetical protein
MSLVFYSMYLLNSRMMFGHIRNAKIAIKAAKKHFEDNSSDQKTWSYMRATCCWFINLRIHARHLLLNKRISVMDISILNANARIQLTFDNFPSMESAAFLSSHFSTHRFLLLDSSNFGLIWCSICRGPISVVYFWSGAFFSFSHLMKHNW